MLRGVSDSCPLSVVVVLCSSVVFFAVSVMARCKNVEGGPGDDERHPPRLTEQEKVKRPKKMVTKKKRKRGDIEAERAAAVPPPLSVLREVAEAVVFILAISCHQLRGLQWRSSRLGMVVHVVLSCLEVSVSLWRMHQRTLV